MQVSLDGLLAMLVAQVAQQPGPRVLVALDGPDAAGKTTMADALAQRLPGQVVRGSIDGFHRPREHRLLTVASMLVDNTDPAAPLVLRRPSG